MRMDTLKRKAKHWVGYWLPTLTIGFAVAIFDWRKRQRIKNDPERILVVMIEHIGDVIVSVPFLRALREAKPSAQITLVAAAGTRALLEHCPLIDRLIVADNETNWFKQLARAFKLGLHLRATQFDVAIVPKDAPNEDFNELICLLAACKQRISRVRPQLAYRMKPLKFAPFYDQIIVDDAVRHEVEQRLRLANLFGTTNEQPKLGAWLTKDDSCFADDFLLGISAARGGPIVSFGIGASAAGRCWPLDRYARIIEQLGRDYGITALAIIGPKEIESARELVRLTNYPVHYAASATLRQSIALIGCSALFIGNDSGPMHMAAAAGVPVVEISTHPQGATTWSINSPERFGAYGVPHRALQPTPKEPQCRNGCAFGLAPHCITNVTVDMVQQAAVELLNEHGHGAESPSSTDRVTPSTLQRQSTLS